MTTDILEEIIQTEKQHKTERLLKTLALIIGAIGIVAVVIAISMSLYDNHKRNKAYMEATELFSALSSLSKNSQTDATKAAEHIKEVTAALEKITKNDSTYSAIASFYLASLSAAQNDASQNIFQYQRIADNKQYDSVFRDYAVIAEIMSRLMLNKIEPDKAISKLNQITQNKDEHSPFILSGLMLQGALYAGNGDRNGASSAINAILTDSKVNDNMKIVANGMKQYIESSAFIANHSNSVNQ